MVRVDSKLAPDSPFLPLPLTLSLTVTLEKHACFQVFKSDVGPDGKARDELDVACAVDHPNLTKALGIVRSSAPAKSGLADASGTNGATTTTAAASAAGATAVTAATGATVATGVTAAAAAAVAAVAAGKTQWLVMERVVGKPLAEKPDFSSVLRCRWGPGRRFEPVLVLAVLLQVCCGSPVGRFALLPYVILWLGLLYHIIPYCRFSLCLPASLSCFCVFLLMAWW